MRNKLLYWIWCLSQYTGMVSSYRYVVKFYAVLSGFNHIYLSALVTDRERDFTIAEGSSYLG
jgi:hypothetical protein